MNIFNNNYNVMLSETMFEISEANLFNKKLFVLDLSDELKENLSNPKLVENILSKDYDKDSFKYTRMNIYEFLKIKLKHKLHIRVAYLNEQLYLFSINSQYMKYISMEKESFFNLLTSITKEKSKMLIRDEISQLSKYNSLTLLKESENNKYKKNYGNRSNDEIIPVLVGKLLFGADNKLEISITNKIPQIEIKLEQAINILKESIQYSDALLSSFKKIEQNLYRSNESIKDNSMESRDAYMKREKKRIEREHPYSSNPTVRFNEGHIEKDIKEHNDKQRNVIMEKIDLCRVNKKQIEANNKEMKNALIEFEKTRGKIHCFMKYPEYYNQDLSKITEIKKIVEYNTNKTCDVQQKIIIDGSNVAWYSFKNETEKKPDIGNIEYLINALKDSGYSDIVLFMDASLKHQVDDIVLFDRFINRIDVPSISVPANSNADLFILDYAQKNRAMIISNDQFRDHVNNGIISESLLRQLLVKYTIVDKTVSMVQQDRGLI